MKSRPDGDSKVQEVRRRSHNLCSLDLLEAERHEVEQKVKGVEERWSDVMQSAKGALDQAERKCALERQLRSFRDVSDTTRAWLQDKQQSLDALDLQSDPERTIGVAQVSPNATYSIPFNSIILKGTTYIYFVCYFPVMVLVLSRMLILSRILKETKKKTN